MSHGGVVKQNAPMRLEHAALIAMVAVGAVRGVRGRPAPPFNDLGFTPAHATPVLYLHGINSRVNAFRQNAEYLRNHRYWVWGYDYGDMIAPGFFGIGNLDEIIDDVAENVDKVLHATGASQVDLVAHSQGGLMAKLYIAAGGASKVRRLVAMGANFHGTDLRGRVDRYKPIIEGHPRFASVVATPGAVQQLSGSPWSLAHANVPDTDPRVVYTSLYSPADTVVTPNSASILRPVEGADVVNVNVADAYNGYAPTHALMPRDPVLAELTRWGLERAVGDNAPPKIVWLES